MEVAINLARLVGWIIVLAAVMDAVGTTPADFNWIALIALGFLAIRHKIPGGK